MKILLDIVWRIEGQTEPDSAEPATFTEADQEIIEQLRARFSKGENSCSEP
jgi:putative methionine-R-sulfoxide reductase with GAF domain